MTVVAPRLLGFAAGLALLVVAADRRRRSRTDDSERRPEQRLSLIGSGLLVFVLVGFDGAFRLIPDPGLPARAARVIQSVLIVLSLAAYAGAGWYWLRD